MKRYGNMFCPSPAARAMMIALAAAALFCAALPACAEELSSDIAMLDPETYNSDEDSEALILSMRQALNIALEKNLDILSAKEDVQRARGQSKAANAGLLPTLGLHGEANAYDMPTQPDTDALAQARVTQSIYSGGRLPALAQQGKLLIIMASADLKNTSEQVINSVWSAYCEMMYRKSVLRTTRNALSYYTNYEQELLKRLEYGLSTNLDLTRVRQQKENARAENISAWNNLNAARIALCTLLRLPPETKIALADDLATGLPDVDKLRGISDRQGAVFKRAVEQRGDYQSLVASAKSQEKEITIAKSGMLPTVSLSGGYRFAYTADHGAGVDNGDQWSVALTMEVPVFDGGLTAGNVKAAKAGLARAQNTVQAKKESIEAEVADTWLTFLNALEALKAGEANLKLATDSLHYAEIGYREGVNTQIDVLQARTDLTSAAQTVAGYMKDSRVAQANLWFAIGELIPRALGDLSFDPQEMK